MNPRCTHCGTDQRVALGSKYCNECFHDLVRQVFARPTGFVTLKTEPEISAPPFGANGTMPAPRPPRAITA